MDISKMKKITPVLLAGGSGTRLWPLSRKSYPKQFSNLIGKMSLFQQTALRLTSSKSIDFKKHLTLTNSDYRFIVVEQFQAVGIDPGPILIEPESKNTAPAILSASIYEFKDDPDAILLVAPSDHIISNVAAFHKTIAKACKYVDHGKIVTFGIKPDHPETGYGYLEVLDETVSGAFVLKNFIEKPDLNDAKSMIAEGNFLWNAGIFMFRAKDMIAAFKKHAPELGMLVERAVNCGEPDLGFLRLNSQIWEKCENISIDYAIMERTDNLVALPFSDGWSDLGDWESVRVEMGPDQNGVATSENAYALNCSNTLLRSENDAQNIVGLGLKDIIAVAMPDAVLVAHRNQTQNVKSILNELKLKNVKQAETFPKDHRPWGWFETLAMRGRFQVKRILVNPGAALSLQSHHHRSEHWIVVEGTAKVTVDNEVKLLSEGESVYIPLASVHRLENPGKLPMLLIEVQTGAYLGEDDIIRYEDNYARD